MLTINLLDILKQESQSFELLLQELKREGTLEIHTVDLCEIITGCVNQGISLKVIPLEQNMVAVSLYAKKEQLKV